MNNPIEGIISAIAIKHQLPCLSSDPIPVTIKLNKIPVAADSVWRMPQISGLRLRKPRNHCGAGYKGFEHHPE
jgi:hypothetical protein